MNPGPGFVVMWPAEVPSLGRGLGFRTLVYLIRCIVSVFRNFIFLLFSFFLFFLLRSWLLNALFFVLHLLLLLRFNPLAHGWKSLLHCTSSSSVPDDCLVARDASFFLMENLFGIGINHTPSVLYLLRISSDLPDTTLFVPTLPNPFSSLQDSLLPSLYHWRFEENVVLEEGVKGG